MSNLKIIRLSKSELEKMIRRYTNEAIELTDQFYRNHINKITAAKMEEFYASKFAKVEEIFREAIKLLNIYKARIDESKALLEEIQKTAVTDKRVGEVLDQVEMSIDKSIRLTNVLEKIIEDRYPRYIK